MSETPRPDEICAKCGYTYEGHLSNTYVLFPCWTPSGRFSATALRFATPAPAAEPTREPWPDTAAEWVWVEGIGHMPKAEYAADAALGAALREALATVSMGDDLALWMLGGAYPRARIVTNDPDVEAENDATRALQDALAAALRPPSPAGGTTT